MCRHGVRRTTFSPMDRDFLLSRCSIGQEQSIYDGSSSTIELKSLNEHGLLYTRPTRRSYRRKPASASRKELPSSRTIQSNSLDHIYPGKEELKGIHTALSKIWVYWMPARLAKGETSLLISSFHPALTSWLWRRHSLTSHTEIISWSQHVLLATPLYTYPEHWD